MAISQLRMNFNEKYRPETNRVKQVNAAAQKASAPPNSRKVIDSTGERERD